MTVVFVGGEITSFTPYDSRVGEVGTGYDTAWARCAMRAIDDLAYFDTPIWGPLTSAWTHMDLILSILSAAVAGFRDVAVWYDGGGAARCALQFEMSTSRVQLTYDGAVVAGPVVLALTSRQILDFDFKVNSAAGHLKMYVAGSGPALLDSGDINLSGVASLGRLRFTGTTVGGFSCSTLPSQVIIASASTLGWKLATFVPTADGAGTAWTGTYADVDEIIYDDGNFISTLVANDIETFALTGPSLGGSAVRAVAVTTRVRHNDTGPQSLQLALRKSGTNYFSATKTLGIAFTPEIGIWETDPSTGVAWVPGDVAGLEAGVKAIA
jgi:hypothetical protein